VLQPDRQHRGHCDFLILVGGIDIQSHTDRSGPVLHFGIGGCTVDLVACRDSQHLLHLKYNGFLQLFQCRLAVSLEH
jgi:hypothetical protein